MSSLIESLRGGRSHGSVLKTRISQVVSKYPDLPVLVFEGDEDVGPYECWLNKITSVKYVPVPGKGKGQLLACRDSIRTDTTSSFERVLFFVDRDFDELRGRPPGPDIYVTPTYSIENQLVSRELFESILLDELKVFAADGEFDSALRLFDAVLKSACCALSMANRRLYYARRLRIDIQIDEAISKYVSIQWNDVSSSADADQLAALMPCAREPSPEECAILDAEFQKLDPISRYRGKLVLRVFVAWLEIISEMRRNGQNQAFPSAVPIKFSSSQLTLRSLASRTQPAKCLVEFIGRNLPPN